MSYQAISATTTTLLGLLQQSFDDDALLAGFFAAGGGSRVVTARTPQEMETANEAGVSIWLYRIERDPELLNHPPERVAADRLRRRPLPLRLHYLVTPVVRDAADVGSAPGMEQLLIGKVLQTFHDLPELAGSDLRGSLTGTGARLRVRMEPLDLSEIAAVWDALDSSYQLCIAYEVAVTLVDSETAAAPVTPVDGVEPEHGLVTAAAAGAGAP
jgi:hypothetical protein